MKDLNTILNSIVDDYCTEFGVKAKDLFRDIKSKSGRTKVLKQTNIANLRMALGYYFTKEFGLPKTFASKFIGYVGHSTMSHNEAKIRWFIENEDLTFLYYYRKLNDVASKYQEDLESMKQVVIKP